MKTTPFWHEAARPGADPSPSAAAFIDGGRVDALVIGGGLTGLSAALHLAKTGRSTLVLEAGRIGDGAASRNGGMIGWGHRARIDALARRFGPGLARDILGEARRSFDFTTGLIEREGIDCRYRRTGRFLAAASPKHFDTLAREMEKTGPELGFAFEILSKADQSAEIATDTYAGGVLLPSHGMLHPGLLAAGLAAAANRAGAALSPMTAVERIDRQGSEWRVSGPWGAVRAGALALAVNGYVGLGGGAFRPFAEGVLPLPSTIIATAPLGAERVKALMPGGRAYVDTRSVHSYFRADPDGERLLWGGRASLNPLPPPVAAERLHGHMASVFPELRDVAVTHCWSGKIAYTRDVVPQIGRFAEGPLEGVWYAGGYCGSGVAMAPYLGWRMAEKILGGPEAATPLDQVRMRKTPFIQALPVALAAIEAWHKLLDWRDGVRPAR